MDFFISIAFEIDNFTTEIMWCHFYFAKCHFEEWHFRNVTFSDVFDSAPNRSVEKWHQMDLEKWHQIDPESGTKRFELKVTTNKGF